jgi:hypothetical protein
MEEIPYLKGNLGASNVTVAADPQIKNRLRSGEGILVLVHSDFVLCVQNHRALENLRQWEVTNLRSQ